MMHFLNISVIARIWVHGVEKRRGTFYSLGHKFRILGQKVLLEFNTLLSQKMSLKPREIFYFLMLKYPVSGRIKTTTYRREISVMTWNLYCGESFVCPAVPLFPGLSFYFGSLGFHCPTW